MISLLKKMATFAFKCLKIVGEFVCLFLVFIFLGASFSVDTVRLGFHCDDDSIRYPYHKDTVPVHYLFACTHSVIWILACFELVNFYLKRRSQRNWVKLGSRFYHVSMYFLYGMWSALLLCQIFKISVGRLRPHFLAVCQPNVTCVHDQTIDAYNGDRYIEQYGCTTENDPKMAWRLLQMRHSFFSGHATIAMYAAVYLIIYIQYHVVSKTCHFLKLLVQNLILSLGFWVGLTRVTDNMHHWSDVLVGYLVGAGFSCLFGFFAYQKLMLKQYMNRTGSACINPNGSLGQLAKREVLSKVIVANPSDLNRQSREMPVNV